MNHPDFQEAKEIQAIAQQLIRSACRHGRAKGRFHGYRVSAFLRSGRVLVEIKNKGHVLSTESISAEVAHELNE